MMLHREIASNGNQSYQIVGKTRHDEFVALVDLKFLCWKELLKFRNDWKGHS